MRYWVVLGTFAATGCNAILDIHPFDTGAIDAPIVTDDMALDGPLADMGLDGAPDATVPVTLAIAAGYDHSCAILGGKLRCWGRGTSGELGHGNKNDIGDNETPKIAGDVPIGVDVESVALGDHHTCVITTGHKVRCWGQSNRGETGYGSTNATDNAATAGDVALGVDAKAIAAGFQHTCVITTTDKVRCWGEGANGKLGYGTVTNIGDNETPASAGDVPLGTGVPVELALGDEHTCALLDTGAVRCWGTGSDGQLGYANGANVLAPSGDVSLATAAIHITAGAFHTCAILADNSVTCWGRGSSGQLGYGNTITVGDDETPASAGAVNIGDIATAIVAGGDHTCARLGSMQLRCWGSGQFGALGLGNTLPVGDNEQPSMVAAIAFTTSAIVAGRRHACVADTGGAIRCFGYNASGQLGYANQQSIGDDELAQTAGAVMVF